MTIKQDPESKLSPLPEYQEKYRERISNFGLFYQKFGKYQLKANGELKTQHSWNNGLRGKDRESYEWSLINNQFDHYNRTGGRHVDLALKNRHDLQRQVLSSYSAGFGVIELSAINTTRLLTGIGEATPTEVGMVFDRNLGLPFIPASSLKGVVRLAYCLNFARDNESLVNDKGCIEEKDILGLVEIFGSLDTKNATRGGFSFLDIHPEKRPKLVIDIMNPHFGKYYRGEAEPMESDEPVPIKFLTVEKEEKFIIRGFFLTDKAQKYSKELFKAMETAFCEVGIGAKTAAGYGRFSLSDVAGAPGLKMKEQSHEKKQEQKSELEFTIWKNATLSYDKGKSELKAAHENGNAFSNDKEIIPDDIYQKLTAKKKKPVASNIMVEPIGRGFRILKIIQ